MTEAQATVVAAVLFAQDAESDRYSIVEQRVQADGYTVTSELTRHTAVIPGRRDFAEAGDDAAKCEALKEYAAQQLFATARDGIARAKASSEPNVRFMLRLTRHDGTHTDIVFWQHNLKTGGTEQHVMNSTVLSELS